MKGNSLDKLVSQLIAEILRDILNEDDGDIHVALKEKIKQAIAEIDVKEITDVVKKEMIEVVLEYVQQSDWLYEVDAHEVLDKYMLDALKDALHIKRDS